MRLIPWVRAYRCASCGKIQLLSPAKVTHLRLSTHEQNRRVSSDPSL